MQVQITEESLKVGTNHYVIGDVVTAKDANHEAELKQWVALGWAKDVETGEQGERKPGANGPIKPHDVISKQA